MGNILLTTQGLEPALIDLKRRDSALRDFALMTHVASKAGDAMCMTLETLSHRFSYSDNPYFTSLAILPWKDFQSKPSLRGVSQKTYELCANIPQQSIYPRRVADVDAFQSLEEPLGMGGYCFDTCPSDFICDKARWQNWRVKYFRDNPQKIDWSTCSDGFLPNKEAIREYLLNELETQLYLKDNEMCHISVMALKDIALLFHEKVMKHKPANGNIEGYAKTVGDNICRLNFYKYDAKLSSNEQKRLHSLRDIWWIEKDGARQYISIDFEKGMFEFHDSKGRHIGEFRFDGSVNASPDSTGRHDLHIS